ncbi:MAG: acyl CoA:acetate/3-ketoacid CoA transferase [Acidimicrobiia bacterium]
MTVSKIVEAQDAVAVIRDGDVVASSGWGGHGVAECVLLAIEERFLAGEGPNDLTLLWAGGQGDGQGRGLDHLGHKGLLRRAVGGHYGQIPKLAQLAVDDEIEAYNLPEGVLVHLYRAIAAGAPGVLSTVGLGTFIDPRFEGGKVNPSAIDDLVELTTRGEQEWLFYPGTPVDIAVIRGTTADPAGNITTEREAVSLEILELAMAAKASNGYVICQVERVADQGSLDSRDVRVPGVLVDAVVVADPGLHMQTFGTQYNPAVSGEIRVPVDSLDPLDVDGRTVIARRAAMELQADTVVNVGLGLPELVGRVAGDERVQDLVTFSIDTGVIGGVPLSGYDFGASVNRESVLDHSSSFDFIDGGGLDTVFLGVAECDGAGNVNVSRFAGRLAGCGGAINLTQRTQRVVFLTPFSSGGLDVTVAKGSLSIVAEGRFPKFVDAVAQVTFSGAMAIERGQEILYVTERCVFTLDERGLVLTEVAPGIDVDADVLSLLPFAPAVDQLSVMPPELFTSGRFGLRDRMLDMRIADRLSYDAATNTVFMDYSGMHVRTHGDVDEIKAEVDALLGPLPTKVNAVVNYDRFRLDEAVVDHYADAVSYVQNTYYLDGGASRHSTNAFMRLKLDREFTKRDIEGSVSESTDPQST